MLAIRQRLSYKQAKWALAVMLLLSFLLIGVQIFTDWQDEKANIHNRIINTLSTVRNAATEAAYSLDDNLAKQVLSGLIQSDAFREVTIKDDLGNNLAYLYRKLPPTTYGWAANYLFSSLTSDFKETLTYKGNMKVGMLTVSVDVGTVTASFIARSIRLIEMTFFATLLFGIVILTLVYFQTSRPLTRFIDKLTALSERKPSEHQLQFDEASRNDELGVLARTFLALWHQQKHVESQLEKSESYFKAVLHQSSECMLLTSLSGRILDCNNASCVLLGYDEKTLLTMNLHDIDCHDIESLAAWSKVQTEEVKLFETEYRRFDGEKIAVEVRSNIITLDGHSRFLASVRDITERKKDQEKVRYLAYNDALTNLPNRRYFNENLEKIITNTRELGRIGGLLFIDLDRFKSINDSLGHHAGDVLLVEVASRIKSLMEEGDLVARIGGDEFVVVLPDLADNLEEAQRNVTIVAEDLLDVLKQPLQIKRNKVLTTASIGISLFPQEQADGLQILQKADTAMYQAKENGRGGLHFYNEAMQNFASKRIAMEKALHFALERQEFYLVYQPQVDEKGRLTGFEVLLRWHNPELGHIPPNQFIPVAEETGLIGELGNWVLETACHQLREWQMMGLPSGFKTLAINISPYQFSKENFVEEVLTVVERTQVDPGLLDFEITEGMLVENITAVAAKMRGLKKHRVRFSIDDFGTGYSSLRYLQHLPIDQLKIDQSFVRDISSDPNSHVIIHTIVSMADHMALSVLAEGVESAFERDILKKIGCLSFQGYYFARPVSVEQATHYLAVNQSFPENQQHGVIKNSFGA